MLAAIIFALIGFFVGKIAGMSVGITGGIPNMAAISGY